MNVLFSIIESLIRNVGGSLGRRIRRIYYKSRLGACGTNLIIDIGVIMDNPNDIFIGDNVWIDNYSILVAGKINASLNIDKKHNSDYIEKEGQLYLSGNNHIAPFVLIQAHGGVIVGRNVTIASGAKVYSLSHHYRNTIDNHDKSEYFFSTMADVNKQFFIHAPVVIGNNAAIGLNSVVLPGTTIPEGTWVGVNTFVVGTECKPNAIYAGQPATFIKEK